MKKSCENLVFSFFGIFVEFYIIQDMTQNKIEDISTPLSPFQLESIMGFPFL